MDWIYKGEKFETIPIDWEKAFYDLEYPNNAVVAKIWNDNKEEISRTNMKLLAHHSKWNKCFWVESVRYCGNGNNLKAYIVDVYTNKYMYTEAAKLELVVKSKQ